VNTINKKSPAIAGPGFQLTLVKVVYNKSNIGDKKTRTVPKNNRHGAIGNEELQSMLFC
jgi:hypothetical protein